MTWPRLLCGCAQLPGGSMQPRLAGLSLSLSLLFFVAHTRIAISNGVTEFYYLT